MYVVAPLEEDSDDDDDDDDFETKQLKDTYLHTCKVLGIIPATSFKNQIASPEVSMRSHPTGQDGARAIAIALVVSISDQLQFKANISESVLTAKQTSRFYQIRTILTS